MKRISLNVTTSISLSIGVLLAVATISSGLLAQSSSAHDRAVEIFRISEQVQSEGNSILTVPVNIPGRVASHLPFVKGLEHYGDLPNEFRPSGQVVHELTVLLIPENEMDTVRESAILSSEMKRVVYLEKDGKRYVRFFILPFSKNFEFYAAEIKKYPRDTQRWMGWQQSSGRSVHVWSPDSDVTPVTIKMDLNISLSGSPRIIKARQVHVAPVVTDLVAQAHSELVAAQAHTDPVAQAHSELALAQAQRPSTGAQAPSTGSWDFMPEPVATTSPGDRGGNIFREYSADFLSGKSTMIPLFALVNNKIGEIWLDRMANAEGITRQALLENEIMPAMVDAFSELSLKYGLTPELHQQNTLLQINMQTGHFEKIVIRDMDAFQIEVDQRSALGLDNSPLKNLSPAELAGSNAGVKVGGRIYRYAFQLRHNFKWLLAGSFLKGVRVLRLVHLADERLLEYATNLTESPRFQKVRDLNVYVEELKKRILLDQAEVAPLSLESDVQTQAPRNPSLNASYGSRECEMIFIH